MQEARLTGRLAYRKVLGTKNPADVLTKHVPAELLQNHLETLCTEVRGGRAESARELNSLEFVILEWKIQKDVRFAKQVQIRPIPAENRGRERRWHDRKKIEGKWERPRTSAGGASPSVQVAILTPRPRWADLCEEEEEENKNAKVTAKDVGHSQRGSRDAESSSGKSENTVDCVEAEAANELRASEGCRERDKYGSISYRASQRF